MNMPEKNSRYQPPQHRRKTPSFSSSLLDSILRSIDETDDDNLHQLQHQQQVHDHDLMFFASEPKRSGKIHFPHAHSINEEEHTPRLRRVIMVDQWIETQNNNNNSNNNNNNNNNVSGYVSSKCSRKYSLDSSCSGTPVFTTSSGSLETSTFPATPSTYRSLPNSFTISRKTAEAVFRDDTQKPSSSKREGKFMRLTKLRALKIYGDLKKAKQPISPGSRISAFIYSLFASSSSKKAKIEESMQNFRSLKKSRSIKQQDATMTCTSFSRSCMSKKQHTSNVKRSVRFYPENDTIIVDGKSVHDRDLDLNHSVVLPKYERRWFAEKNYTKNYKKFMVNIEDDDEDEDEDDLFELEIVGGVRAGSYGQELPVFETTDLREIRI